MNVCVCRTIYLCGYNHFLIQTASLCTCSWPQTPYVNQGGLKVTEVLPLPPGSWNLSMYHHAW